jgi:type IV pilus assembly protein PilE
MTRPPTCLRAPRGFTLVELGVALAVAAILAAVVLPDLVEASRDEQAERTALDISYLHDAARWYRSQTNGITDSSLGIGADTWPGQSSGGATGCSPIDSSTAFQNLKANGFLVEGQPVNPWGKDYTARELNHVGTAGNPSMGCMFMVSTEVPTPVADKLRGMLPQAICNDPVCGPPALTAGYSRCCSGAVRPGMLLAEGCRTAGAPSRFQVLRFRSSTGNVTCED